ncbi:aminotransferase family protein [Natrinema ejinorense]|uniref:Aspartate aminotransferase family protein n=1 Tax=Natrinema ejinorense TaxID=373386 RepID=A0A2A5QS21_9EURY|nr:aminotransferase class III-fold pyridoxal phosphate-dependent enzyme [Natrinema ejinorense]PCR89579.1 hypothetical protein CP557_02945 [Natrinema ejinorense]
MGQQPAYTEPHFDGLFPQNFHTPNIDFEKGVGETIIDANGNTYIDVASGNQNVTIGHGREEIAEAAYEQLSSLEYIPMQQTTESVRSFGETITGFMPDGFERAWLVSGGSLAVESTIAMVRQYHTERGNERKHKFITRRGSYHGTTLGALSATGFEMYTTHMDPLLQDFPKAPRGNQYRCTLCGGGGGSECGRRCADMFEQLVLEHGPENVAAFMAEPVGGSQSQGERPHPEYFERVREICDEYDILFVVDEILTGIGRTGTNFAIEQYDITPDIIVTGKGVTAGYAPAGVVMPHNRVVEVFREIPHGFAHGYTNCFHPGTAAIAKAVLEFTRQNELVENAATVGSYLGERLTSLYDYDAVGDVRGVGLLHGVEFVADRETKEPLDVDFELQQALVEAGLDNGVLLSTEGGHLDGKNGDLLVIAPPLTIEETQVDDMVDRIYTAVGDALARVGVA